MSFEVKDKDLLGRIGKLQTKSGTLETPLLFPVVNPNLHIISPSKMRENFGFEALITNAYILKKRFQNKPVEKGIHRFLDFNGVVMTDSGAYQILLYGNIEVTPEEIVEYQEKIDVDIATILDWPTGWGVSREYAQKTVNETVKRAEEFFKLKKRNDILWVGPVQGGCYLDLVAESAVNMRKLPFQIHALGSPTEVMERYRFDALLDMIVTAKINLPIERPLHLFGAGHPFMFSLAVALGCDLFDSAAYALYARENRYMTEAGTLRLNELKYFPCSCPKCSGTTPKDILEAPKNEKQDFLAEHNLYACISEIKRIKQAIKEGRLWEHLELRMHGHPALLQSLKKIGKYADFIEKHSPAVKPGGLFFYDSIDLNRPEVVRHRKRIAERYSNPENSDILLLIPQNATKPFHKSREYREATKVVNKAIGEKANRIHVCFYAAPFGVIPTEIDEVYPLSQHETVIPADEETVGYVASQVANYIAQRNYRTIILIHNSENWENKVLKASKKACSVKGIKFKYFDVKGNWIKTMPKFLRSIVKEDMGDKL